MYLIKYGFLSAAILRYNSLISSGASFGNACVSYHERGMALHWIPLIFYLFRRARCTRRIGPTVFPWEQTISSSILDAHHFGHACDLLAAAIVVEPFHWRTWLRDCPLSGFQTYVLDHPVLCICLRSTWANRLLGVPSNSMGRYSCPLPCRLTKSSVK